MIMIPTKVMIVPQAEEIWALQEQDIDTISTFPGY